MFKQYHRPVILIGHGCTGVDLTRIMQLGVPVITSWQAIDLVDNYAETYMGRVGIYGNRHSNRILYNADVVIAIGCRLSIWQVGYGVFAPSAKLVIADIDSEELKRFPDAETHCDTAEGFMGKMDRASFGFTHPWLDQCIKWKTQYPLLEACHTSKTHIHSHQLVSKLQQLMRHDEIVVTDMGAAMVAAHQILQFRPPQRIMTSGGLGEMGVALPAAIGASIASGKRVLCLHCDGGMMMNLQELATIAHHDLPIKIIVFNNNGYGMIKRTQDVTLHGNHVGVGSADMTFPYFVELARSFGIAGMRLKEWEDFYNPYMTRGLESDKPFLVDFHMDQDQPLYPKLNPIRRGDGSIQDARFDEMTPYI